MVSTVRWSCIGRAIRDQGEEWSCAANKHRNIFFARCSMSDLVIMHSLRTCRAQFWSPTLVFLQIFKAVTGLLVQLVRFGLNVRPVHFVSPILRSNLFERVGFRFFAWPQLHDDVRHDFSPSLTLSSYSALT